MDFRTTILVLAGLLIAGGSQAADCKFEIEEVDHIEAPRLIMFRGATVGLGGQFGVKDGENYLRGFFGSNFKARALFNAEIRAHHYFFARS